MAITTMFGLTYSSKLRARNSAVLWTRGVSWGVGAAGLEASADGTPLAGVVAARSAFSVIGSLVSRWSTENRSLL